jgi:hypothetical protein
MVTALSSTTGTTTWPSKKVLHFLSISSSDWQRAFRLALVQNRLFATGLHSLVLAPHHYVSAEPGRLPKAYL